MLVQFCFTFSWCEWESKLALGVRNGHERLDDRALILLLGLSLCDALGCSTHLSISFVDEGVCISSDCLMSKKVLCFASSNLALLFLIVDSQKNVAS